FDYFFGIRVGGDVSLEKGVASALPRRAPLLRRDHPLLSRRDRARFHGRQPDDGALLGGHRQRPDRAFPPHWPSLGGFRSRNNATAADLVRRQTRDRRHGSPHVRRDDRNALSRRFNDYRRRLLRLGITAKLWHRSGHG